MGAGVVSKKILNTNPANFHKFNNMNFYIVLIFKCIRFVKICGFFMEFALFFLLIQALLKFRISV